MPCSQAFNEHRSKDPNHPGTLSMANTGKPSTGGSQFFVNLAHNSYFDWFSKHVVFGKVIVGVEVAEAISKVPTQDDNPITPIMMNSITISFPAGA